MGGGPAALNDQTRSGAIGLRLGTAFPLVCASCGTTQATQALKTTFRARAPFLAALVVLAVLVDLREYVAGTLPNLTFASDVRATPALACLGLLLWHYASFQRRAQAWLPLCPGCREQLRTWGKLSAFLYPAVLVAALSVNVAWFTEAVLAIIGLTVIRRSRGRLAVAAVTPNRVWLEGLHPAAIEAYAENGAYVLGRWRPHACSPVRGRSPGKADEILDGGPGPVSVAVASDPESESPSRRIRMLYRRAEERARALGVVIILLASAAWVTSAVGFMAALVARIFPVARDPNYTVPWGEISAVMIVLAFFLVPVWLVASIGRSIYRLQDVGHMVGSLFVALCFLILWRVGLTPVVLVMAVTFILVLWGPAAWTVFSDDYRGRVTNTPSLNRLSGLIVNVVLILALWGGAIAAQVWMK